MAMRPPTRATLATAAALLGALWTAPGFGQTLAVDTVTIHVDAANPAADDANAGTAERPVATVAESARRALANRRLGRSSHVVIHPGIYRESVDLTEATTPPDAPPILFEGAVPGLVVLSGSDPWSDWIPAGTNLYRHPFPGARGPAELPEGWDDVRSEVEDHPVLLRGEAVFVGGELYRQVMSSAELGAAPRRFFVDERRGIDQAQLWIHVPTGIEPTGAQVEVSLRSPVVSLTNVAAITLRHLVVRHAASRLQDAAVRIDGCADVTLERVAVEWNSWNGIAIMNSRDVRLRDVTANRNGAGGLSGWKVANLTMDAVEASYNNWRGAWGGFLGWATGQKFFHLHGARLVGYRAVGNATTGLWFDTDATDVIVERSFIADNATRGVFIEAVQGPIVIRDTTIKGNGEIGIFATGASQVTLDRNVIVDNGEHQVLLPWQADQHVVTTVTDSRTAQDLDVRSTGWTVTNNIIGSAGAARLFSVGMWPHFFDTFRASGNRWYRGDGEEGFGVYARMHAPVRPLTLAAWQQLSHQDGGSTFADRR
jgi:hypothetical protein